MSNRFELQDDGGCNLSKNEKRGFWTEGRMWADVQLIYNQVNEKR